VDLPDRRGPRVVPSNIERFDRQVCNWTLETVLQGLQKRVLHTLTYHHASNKFNAVMQGTKTIQELMNELTRYAARMIQQPDDYTLRRRFVSACTKLCAMRSSRRAITRRLAPWMRYATQPA
jgi:hypothetical protein